MLRLDLASGPTWLDVGQGVRLHVAPLSTTIMAAAQREVDPDQHPNDAAVAMARAIAHRAIVDWDGVGDSAGEPVPVSPEWIDRLLEVWPIFEAFQRLYVAPGVALDAEKNGFAPLPNGTSAGATATARPAKGRAPSARRD